MADGHFFKNEGPFSLQDISNICGAALHIPAYGARQIDDVASLEQANEHQISFLDNVKYIDAFRLSKAGACIIRPQFVEKAPAGMALLMTPQPYLAYARVAAAFYPTNKESEISPAAHIHPTATIGKSCSIAPGVVIGKGVVIGDHCIIHANAVISHVVIGNRVIIHPGTAIGQDGFGYALNEKYEHQKVPQLGRVIIEDDVEIGANSCIDRGSGPDTIIGRGTKIDNLVQIGHNVQLGKGCIVVSQVGISGSTKVGDYTVFGGQAGVAGHLNIGAHAKIAAQAGVMRDIPERAVFGGSPAVPVTLYHRQTVALEQLARGVKKKRGGQNDGNK